MLKILALKKIISIFTKNKFAHLSLQRIVGSLDAIVLFFSEVVHPHDLPSRSPTAIPRFFVSRLS